LLNEELLYFTDERMTKKKKRTVGKKEKKILKKNLLMQRQELPDGQRQRTGNAQHEKKKRVKTFTLISLVMQASILKDLKKQPPYADMDC